MIYCVNDPAVMDAWAKDQKIADSHVKFYSDPFGTFTKHFDMELTHPGVLAHGVVGRCKRHAMYIDDGEVKYQALSEDPDFDPAGDQFPEKTLPPAMIAAIKEIQEKE
jgi:peroxiredoxin